jgi:5'-3' exonuclease
MIFYDISNIALATAFTFHKNCERVPEPTELRNLITSSIGDMLPAISNYSAKHDVIALEGFKSWRKQKYPFYKAKRKAKRDESPFDFDTYYKHLALVFEDMKQYSNWLLLQHEEAEADDIISTLALKAKKPVCIVSVDKDFLQLQTFKPDIVQYSPLKRDFLNPSEYKLSEHILGGDTVDGVPNVFSPEDTFLTEGKRQTPFTKKLKDKLSHLEEDQLLQELTEEQKHRFFTNKELIDARCVPEKIQDEILQMAQDAYKEKVNRTL